VGAWEIGWGVDGDVLEGEGFEMRIGRVVFAMRASSVV